MNVLNRLSILVDVRRSREAARSINEVEGALRGVSRATASAGVRARMFSAQLGMKHLEKFGTGLQWTGRQIEYRFTLPIVAAGLAAAKFALDNEKAFTRLKKVYGTFAVEGRNVTKELKDLRSAFEAMSNIFGVLQSQVIEIAATFASAGAAGAGLARATASALEAMILGDLDAERATSSLIVMMSAFGMTTKELKASLAALNMVENETAINFGDLISVIERTGSIASTAGVDLRHLAAMAAALVPASGSAERAGNGLRSIITRLLAPTKQATEMLTLMGIASADFAKLSATGRLELLASEFANLSDAQKVVVEKFVSGNYQIDKFDKLLRDIANPLGNYHKALAVTASETKNLLQYRQELLTYLASQPQAFSIVWTNLQNAMARILVPLLPAILAIAQHIGLLASKFSELSPTIQMMVVAGLGALAVLGPLMAYIGTTAALVGRLGGGFVWLGTKLAGWAGISTAANAAATAAALATAEAEAVLAATAVAAAATQATSAVGASSVVVASTGRTIVAEMAMAAATMEAAVASSTAAVMAASVVGTAHAAQATSATSMALVVVQAAAASARAHGAAAALMIAASTGAAGALVTFASTASGAFTATGTHFYVFATEVGSSIAAIGTGMLALGSSITPMLALPWAGAMFAIEATTGAAMAAATAGFTMAIGEIVTIIPSSGVVWVGTMASIVEATVIAGSVVTGVWVASNATITASFGAMPAMAALAVGATSSILAIGAGSTVAALVLMAEVAAATAQTVWIVSSAGAIEAATVWAGSITAISAGFQAIPLSATVAMAETTAVFALGAGTAAGSLAVIPAAATVAGAATAAGLSIGVVALVAAAALAAAAVVGLVYTFRKEIAGGIRAAVDFITRGFNMLPQSIKSAMVGVIRVIGFAVEKARDLLSYLNPFARHSPSLVDNVRAGVAVIAAEYASLGSIGAAFAQATDDIAAFNAATAGARGSAAGADRREQRGLVASASPGALPAFDALTADSAVLAVALSAVNDEFQRQGRVVAAAQFAYDALAWSLGLAEVKLSDLESAADASADALAAAQAEVARLAAYAPVGMGALADATFENTTEQARLRLAIMEIEDGLPSLEAVRNEISRLESEAQGFERQLAVSKEALDAFATAPLVGMRAMSDAIFGNELAQKSLRLEMLRLEDSGQGIDSVNDKMALLAGEIESLRAESIDLRMAGAGSDITGALDAQIQSLEDARSALSTSPVLALSDQLEDLQRQGEILDLENALAFDPLLRQIEQLVDTTKELTFEEVIAGITAQQAVMGPLQASLDANNAALLVQTELLDGLEAARLAATSAMQGELDALGRQAEELGLIQAIDFDPLLRQLDLIQNPRSEMPYADLAAQLTAAVSQVDLLTAADLAATAAVAAQQIVVDDLARSRDLASMALSTETDRLERLGETFDAIEQAISDADSAMSDFAQTAKQALDDASFAASQFAEAAGGDFGVGEMGQPLSFEEGDIDQIIEDLKKEYATAFTKIDPFGAIKDAFSSSMDWLKRNAGVMFTGAVIGAFVGGPIGAVIGAAIGPLIAGPIASGLGAAWNLAVGMWQQYIAPALEPVGAVISGAMNVVGAAFGGIAAAAGLAWDVLSTVVGAIAGAIGGVLSPVFESIGEHVSEVWTSIGSIIRDTWKTVIKPAWDGIKNAIDLFLLPVFRTLRDVTTEIFKGIGSLIQTTWTDFIKPVFDILWTVISTSIVPVFQVLQFVAQIVFAAIGAAVWLMWTVYVQPALTALDWIIRNALAPTISWLSENVVGPAMDAIGSAIAAMWWFVAPVLETLRKFLVDNVGPAFATLKDLAAAGFRGMVTAIRNGVQWAINAFNKLGEGINWISDKLHLSVHIDKIPDLPEVGDIMGGGDGPAVTRPGVMHGGGVVGQSRDNRLGRTGGIRGDEQLTLLQKGEGVLPVGIMKALGGSGFAKIMSGAMHTGGVVGHEHGGKSKGILGGIGDAIGGLVDGARRAAVMVAFAPFMKAADAVIDRIPLQFARDAARNLKNDVYNWAKGENEMAAGGIVTGPTRALIGEAGAEAVLPLAAFYAKLDDGFRSIVSTVNVLNADSAMRAARAESYDAFRGTGIVTGLTGVSTGIAGLDARLLSLGVGVEAHGPKLDAIASTLGTSTTTLVARLDAMSSSLTSALSSIRSSTSLPSQSNSTSPALGGGSGPNTRPIGPGGKNPAQMIPVTTGGRTTMMTLAQAARLVPSFNLANGGIIKARPGGTLVRAGEAGQDEAFVPLPAAGLGGRTVNLYGDLVLPNIATADDADALISALEALAE